MPDPTDDVELPQATVVPPKRSRISIVWIIPVLAALVGVGIAAHFTFGGYAAHAVEVTVGERGELTIERIVAAVDCGLVVNPLGVEAQLQGGKPGARNARALPALISTLVASVRTFGQVYRSPIWYAEVAPVG